MLYQFAHWNVKRLSVNLKKVTTQSSPNGKWRRWRLWGHVKLIGFVTVFDSRTFHFYRPQQSCGKVIFSQASVSHSVHGGWCLPQCMLGYTPWADTPLKHTPRREAHPPEAPPSTAADGMHPTGMLSCLKFANTEKYVRNTTANANSKHYIVCRFSSETSKIRSRRRFHLIHRVKIHI